MRFVCAAVLLLAAAEANNHDLFNYGFSDNDIDGGTDFGQQNWGEVSCDDLETCTGYPDKFLHGKGFSIEGSSNCLWCPENGPQNCGLHRQSPIDLQRNRGIAGDPMEKECPDWHWMQFRNDTCSFDDDLIDQFVIERHALKLNIPINEDGEIDCEDDAGLRQFARLDYSKGFPDWWWLEHTSIQVPSQHTQEGKRYDAEVTLAHFYEIDHPKNQLGNVVIFLEAYNDTAPWSMLDKLICQWRRVEEEARSSCGLDPSPPYGRCALFRDQDPTAEWIAESKGELFGAVPPTSAPLNSIVNATEAPFGGLGGASIAPSMAQSVSPTSPVTELPTAAVVTTEPTHTVAPPDPDSIPWWQSWGNPIDVLSPPSSEPAAVTNESPVSLSTGTPLQNSTTTVGNSANSTGGVGVPAMIECGNYSSVGLERMCASSQPCCESTRSETTFCWDLYENVFPGSLIDSACYHCCDTPKVVGPPAPVLPELPKTVQCSMVDSPFRICKPDSCCTNPRSTSSYCNEIYDEYGDDIEQICHYCCAESQDVGPALRRGLRGLDSTVGSSKANTQDEIPEGYVATHVNGRRLLLGPENFDEDIDEHVYFEQVMSDYKRRKLQNLGIHEEDYANVAYWPYEWLLEVGTEYYFRYEGTQTVPPCWEVVHWRVMKDPIKVHPRQIEELNRLLAWRLSTSGSNECEVDTAGRLSDDGNTVDVSRETQYYHLQHRKVFCECKDWPSKFEGDKEWCKNWKLSNGEDRFYDTPYSFDTGGEW